MEDTYPSLKVEESMEWEDTVKTNFKDEDKENEVVKSRWPEQEQHLVSCFAKHLADKITELVKKDCYGCQNNHPSQIQHDKCLMMSQEEKLDEYLDEAWSLIAEETVLHEWYKGLCDHSCPPLTTREIYHIEALLAQSWETRRRNGYLSELFKQKVRIELMTYHHL
ncbi:hypothetical protein CHS0354_034562 [Potamilus streckersoni]|uniref:Uncharacterized protein n=1 Tax=Potamilus streckersoni TaxID=2493646 RepID=A0AAE0RR28_9BIVA|nr:hypothetical protein CHS0354_034562 [Potamilus streckersoni]